MSQVKQNSYKNYWIKTLEYYCREFCEKEFWMELDSWQIPLKAPNT